MLSQVIGNEDLALESSKVIELSKIRQLLARQAAHFQASGPNHFEGDEDEDYEDEDFDEDDFDEDFDEDYDEDEDFDEDFDEDYDEDEELEEDE